MTLQLVCDIIIVIEIGIYSRKVYYSMKKSVTLLLILAMTLSMTACAGNPAADVARTWLLLKYGEMRNADKKTAFVVSAVKAIIRRQYLRNVCRLSHITRTEVDSWIVPVAAARLSEWLTESERRKLLRLIREKL